MSGGNGPARLHPSVITMWQAFLACHPDLADGVDRVPSAWHFCDNDVDADECARLVVAGIKRATAPSLWSFTSRGEDLPAVGDLHVVTDWSGEARCVIRTTSVEVLPFNRIGDEHARLEGEGDGSLQWWRQAHWAYYQRESEGTQHVPAEDMPIVFETFECIHPASMLSATKAADTRSG